MSWIPLEKELLEMAAAEPGVRLSYLVRRTVETGRLWSLRHAKGWAVSRLADGRTAVPVWPHARFAQRCAAGEWGSMIPAAIPLHEWRGQWQRVIRKDGRVISVFPAIGRPGVILDFDEMLAHLHSAEESLQPLAAAGS